MFFFNFYKNFIFFGFSALESARKPLFLPCNHQNSFVMPVHKTKGGWQWGQSGKVYPTKEQAEAQGRAIYASGYREKPQTTKKK